MIQIDMKMPRKCKECPMCMEVRDTFAYCMLLGFQLKLTELDLKDGYCPLKEVPTGKWICESKGRNYADYHCSVCGQKLSLCGQDIHERMTEGYSLYCDRCGSRMVEEQQGETT